LQAKKTKERLKTIGRGPNLRDGKEIVHSRPVVDGGREKRKSNQKALAVKRKSTTKVMRNRDLEWGPGKRKKKQGRPCMARGGKRNTSHRTHSVSDRKRMETQKSRERSASNYRRHQLELGKVIRQEGVPHSIPGSSETRGGEKKHFHSRPGRAAPSGSNFTPQKCQGGKGKETNVKRPRRWGESKMGRKKTVKVDQRSNVAQLARGWGGKRREHTIMARA